MTDGNYKCWGSNSRNQLGDGTTTNRATPVVVSNLGGTVHLDKLGNSDACVLLTTGIVKCWGDNRWSTGGTSPRTISGIGGTVMGLGGGCHHACALLSSGGVQCWGRGHSGSIGDGSWTDRSSATNANLGEAAELVAGSCYDSFAVLTSGVVKAWGLNSRGSLGIGSSAQRVASPTTVNMGGRPVLMQGGYLHTCAVLDTGITKCWGANDNGQVGDGSTSDRNTPVTINVGGTPMLLSLGYWHTCVVLAENGVTKCWGKNDARQIGDGTTTDRTTPFTVNVGGAAVALSTTIWGTCVVLSDGRNKCWGKNDVGQFGDGTTTTETGIREVSTYTVLIPSPPPSPDRKSVV